MVPRPLNFLHDHPCVCISLRAYHCVHIIACSCKCWRVDQHDGFPPQQPGSVCLKFCLITAPVLLTLLLSDKYFTTYHITNFSTVCQAGSCNGGPPQQNTEQSFVPGYRYTAANSLEFTSRRCSSAAHTGV